MNKKNIRANISALKKNYSTQILSELSQKICDRLAQTSLFQNAHCIAMYYGLKDEVQTTFFIEDWSDKKKIVLPVIHDNDIHFYTYTGKENLSKGAFEIQEPASAVLVPPEEIDLFIVPGVAFDRYCNRLGRGKGYYDRYLTGLIKPVIGLCFDFQLLDTIPAENHDVKMTMVITEHRKLKAAAIK